MKKGKEPITTLTALLIEGSMKQSEHLRVQLNKGIFKSLQNDAESTCHEIERALINLEEMNVGNARRILEYLLEDVPVRVENHRFILTGEKKKGGE